MTESRPARRRELDGSWIDECDGCGAMVCWDDERRRWRHLLVADPGAPPCHLPRGGIAPTTTMPAAVLACGGLRLVHAYGERGWGPRCLHCGQPNPVHEE